MYTVFWLEVVEKNNWIKIHYHRHSSVLVPSLALQRKMAGKRPNWDCLLDLSILAKAGSSLGHHIWKTCKITFHHHYIWTTTMKVSYLYKIDSDGIDEADQETCFSWALTHPLIFQQWSFIFNNLPKLIWSIDSM